MPRVMIFGTFDIIHLGHIKMIKKAKEIAGKDGELIAVVARNENVIRFKGHPPIFDENERLEIISAIKYVDRAILGHEKDIFKIIEEYKPDIIALGYDQPAEEVRRRIKELGLRVKVVVLPQYRSKISSSTEARKKAAELIISSILQNQNVKKNRILVTFQ